MLPSLNTWGISLISRSGSEFSFHSFCLVSSNQKRKIRASLWKPTSSCSTGSWRLNVRREPACCGGLFPVVSSGGQCNPSCELLDVPEFSFSSEGHEAKVTKYVNLIYSSGNLNYGAVLIRRLVVPLPVPASWSVLQLIQWTISPKGELIIIIISYFIVWGLLLLLQTDTLKCKYCVISCLQYYCLFSLPPAPLVFSLRFISLLQLFTATKYQLDKLFWCAAISHLLCLWWQ